MIFAGTMHLAQARSSRRQRKMCCLHKFI